MNTTFVEEMKAKLLAEQAKLQTELSLLPEHVEIGASDQGENSEEMEIDMVTASVGARIKSDLAKIEKALLKIADGTYGTDDEGRTISEDRLRVLPWADKAI